MDGLTLGLQAELVGRLVLSVMLGSVLGWERQLGQHPAGLRTHMLVSLGAAAYTIAGTYGVSGHGTVQDAGRVSAQIVTGIGFLCAGTIWRAGGDSGVIRGLTTAASIWVAASIGMLSGYGLYVLAPGVALISFAVLRLIKGLEHAPGAIVRYARTRAVRRPRPVIDSPFVSSLASTEPAVADPDAGAADPTTLPAMGEETARLEPHKARKHKRPRKKDGKRKKRDAASEPNDQISDESIFSVS